MEESSALSAASSANGLIGMADVRSVRRQLFLRDDDDDDPEDVGLVADNESPLFHQRREDLIVSVCSHTSVIVTNSNSIVFNLIVRTIVNRLIELFVVDRQIIHWQALSLQHLLPS